MSHLVHFQPHEETQDNSAQSDAATLTLAFALDDLDSIFATPHDDPPSYAIMLTAYIDESMQAGDAHVVVAGFMGNTHSWSVCMRKWRAALAAHGRTSLHLKELRGWHDNRNKQLLEDLGAVPQLVGLRLIYGSVNISDYKDLIDGKALSIMTNGYMTALHALLRCALAFVPVGQRLKVVSEEQAEYSFRRSLVFQAIQREPMFQSRAGISKLASFESLPKSSVLEPADFAAYAKMQELADPTSRKALLCAPILKNRLQAGISLNEKDVRGMVEAIGLQHREFSELRASKSDINEYLHGLENFVRSSNA